MFFKREHKEKLTSAHKGSGNYIRECVKRMPQNNEDSQHLRRCLELLTEEQRLMVLAYYYDELSIKEIADIFQIGESTAKSRLHLAEKCLMTIIIEKEGADQRELSDRYALTLAAALGDMMNNHIKITKKDIAGQYYKTCDGLKI